MTETSTTTQSSSVLEVSRGDDLRKEVPPVLDEQNKIKSNLTKILRESWEGSKVRLEFKNPRRRPEAAAR